MTLRVCVCVCAWNHSRLCTFTQLTRPRISTVGSFHIFEISHTCVIMLCSHITLKTPAKPQLSMQHTTATYTFFLQPLPVPSSLSVNNPLCPVCQTHTSVLETQACVGKRMWDATAVGCWCAIEPRFPVTQGTAAHAHKRTHAHTHTRRIHSVWNWECLYSQRNKAVSCVYDCVCFSWPEIAGLTVSHSAMTRGVYWTWCVNTALQLSAGALDCLSMFVFVCTHDDSTLSLHLS